MLGDREYKRFSDEFSYSEEPSRSWQSIKPQISLYLGQIENNLELLKKLYVPVNTRLYDRTHLVTTFLNISPLEIEEFEKKSSKALDFNNFISSKLKLFDRFFFILILSPIGRGKTTFIYHNLLIDIPQLFPKIIWKPIFINVKNCETDFDDYIKKIKMEVDRTITESYECFNPKTDDDLLRYHKTLCEIFKKDLLNRRIPSEPANSVNNIHYQKQNEFFTELEKNNFGDFQKKRLSYARKIESSVYIILVIDNMDQHIQFHREKMIVEAHAIAANIGIPLIITLRDTSFRTNNSYTALASYKPDDYLCFDSVPISQILAKRFNQLYLDFKMQKENPFGFKFIKILEKHFCEISDNITNEKSDLVKILPWISNVPNNNKRKALEVVAKALESKIVIEGDFDRYPHKVDEGDLQNDKIHFKKLQTAFLIGNNNYFVGDSSNVDFINLFDCNVPSNEYNYILRIKILQYFELDKSSGQKIKYTLEKFLSALGREYDTIMKETLRIFIEKGLLMIYKQSPIDESTIEVSGVNINIETILEDNVYLGHNGLFHIKDLIFNDIYLDEMKFSTYIHKDKFKEIFEHYKGGFKPLNHEQRYNSTEKFIKYILEYEKQYSKNFDDNLKTKPIMKDVYDKYRKARSRYFT